MVNPKQTSPVVCLRIRQDVCEDREQIVICQNKPFTGAGWAQEPWDSICNERTKKNMIKGYVCKLAPFDLKGNNQEGTLNALLRKKFILDFADGFQRCWHDEEIPLEIISLHHSRGGSIVICELFASVEQCSFKLHHTTAGYVEMTFLWTEGPHLWRHPTPQCCSSDKWLLPGKQHLSNNKSLEVDMLYLS